MDFRDLQEREFKTGANPLTILIAEKYGTLAELREHKRED